MNELISLNQVTLYGDNSFTPSNALLLKARLIDSVESISTFSDDGHSHSCLTITVGLCSNNPKPYDVYESTGEIAKKIEQLNQ